MASSLVSAHQTTVLLRNPLSDHRRIASLSLPSPYSHRRLALPLSSAHSHRRIVLSKPKHLPFSQLRKPSNPIFACSAPQESNPNPVRDTLTGSTRAFATIGAVALAASKLVPHELFTLAVQVKEPVVKSAGPAFFAAVRNSQSGGLNTPLTVVAAGMAKWLDIYSGVLMIRCSLSWFPNIPWDKQPLSAIRDLCDPFLNLFKNIIPPIGGVFDVSSLLAFAVLGTLGSILSISRQAF